MTTIRVSVDSSDARSVDVLLSADTGASGALIADAIAGLGFQRGGLMIEGMQLAEASSIRELPLVHGTEITRSRPSSTVPPSNGLHLVVAAGPMAGAWHPLDPDTSLTVGRDNAAFSLREDRLLSGRHAAFTMVDSQVFVEDLHSANGTFLEGERIVGRHPVAVGDFVHVGSSTLVLVSVAEADRAPLGPPSDGAIPFPRTFRRASPGLPKDVRLPRPVAVHRDAGGTSLWRALLPLVSGIGFAIVSRNLGFLLISALAPLVYAADALRQKKAESRESSSSREAYQRAVERAQLEYQSLTGEHRRRCRADQPVGGMAAFFALVRHARIWERRPQDEDFLSVGLGLTRRKSAIALVDESNTPQTSHTEVWGMPVSVNVAHVGAIAVLGEAPRVRAVVRSLLLALAVYHSPGDVKMWIFCSDGSDADWSPLRWLPHVFFDPETARIASTPGDRSRLLSAVRQVMDGRRDQSRPGAQPPLPVHIVVFDGADLLPSNDISEILTNGPGHGVFGIVADARVAPDGTMGTVRLGRAADEATFESRLEPFIDNVLLAEMPAKFAEAGARRLAGLKPSTSTRDEMGVDSERLADLLTSPQVSADELRTKWAQRGPATRVPVGTAADATFSIDIVHDGPHGLVGGMTRSGKTEFLKTLLTSLAWANHPDDLLMVIVDFKGGVDYTVAGRLPHVLDVSSNQDLGAFERTLLLLGAELRRRQQLFGQLEVSNLDAYRIERSTRPELPVVPRLLVVIDEFGELLASDVGRDQLRRIESMSRIGAGLGLNLLLITQNFEGQLPPQIAANAGMRVCFRVQEAGNSKVVIESSLAATIAASSKGRAYARLQGADPVEFQSARVAGRRAELRSSAARVTARLQPFGALMTSFSDGEPVDVPAHETDMWAMINTIVEATAMSGWTAPAVPWPAVLPGDLPLAKVLALSGGEGIPIGLVDVPEFQTQQPLALQWTDDHVALLGGPKADLNTLLTVIACSAATKYSPEDLHIYAIDFAGRGLARIGDLPHCGGVATRNDSLSVRIGRYLSDQLSIRRAALAREGVSSLTEYAHRTGKSFPHILLLVAGAERLSSIAGTEEQSPAAAPLASIIAEGTGLGVQVIAAGPPAVCQYKPGTLIDRRFFFDAPETSDYLMMGCPRNMLGALRGARRGIDSATGLLVQFCSLAGGAADESDVLEGLVHRLRSHYSAPLRRPPTAFLEVSWPLPISSLATAVRRIPPRMKRPFLVGVDTQTAEPIWMDSASFDGPLFVAGPRRSGRSSALLALGLLARHVGWNVVGVGGGAASPLNEDDCPFLSVPIAEADQAIERLASPSLVLVDDVHLIPERQSGTLNRLSNVDLLVISGPTSTFSGLQRVLVERDLSRATTGVVLMPSGYEDLDLVGARSDPLGMMSASARRPGQGLLGWRGDVADVTIPLLKFDS